jgi:hypothetical protein
MKRLEGLMYVVKFLSGDKVFEFGEKVRVKAVPVTDRGGP